MRSLIAISSSSLFHSAVASSIDLRLLDIGAGSETLAAPELSDRILDVSRPESGLWLERAKSFLHRASHHLDDFKVPEAIRVFLRGNDACSDEAGLKTFEGLKTYFEASVADTKVRSGFYRLLREDDNPAN